MPRVTQTTQKHTWRVSSEMGDLKEEGLLCAMQVQQKWVYYQQQLIL